jgi:hypothetical protein
MQKENEEVYAILRYDGFHGTDAPAEISVTVKEVVRGQAIAEAEVARLNERLHGPDEGGTRRTRRLRP